MSRRPPAGPTLGTAPVHSVAANEVLLATLFVFSPLALGVVAAWSEMVVVALTGTMALFLALGFLLRAVRPLRTVVYLPLALFLLFALFQLLPLPASVVELLSPHTASVKGELLGDLPDAGARLQSMAITFERHGTLHALRLSLAVAAVFVVSLHLARDPRGVRRLLTVVTTIGTALAVLALAQIATGTGKIYWLISTTHEFALGGPFVNRNNFCVFMNLSLGATLALLLLKLDDGLERVPKRLGPVLDWVLSARAKWVWILAAALVVEAASVFLSLSRGGAISLLIAGTVVSLAMAFRRGFDGRAWVMVTVALGAFICVLYLGFDAVYDRLATLRDQHAFAGRWQIVKDIALAWTRFPLVGTGLGTHEVVYPMFERATIPAIAAYAENEYAQILEETGLIGLLLLSAFITLVWVVWGRCVRRGGWRASVAYGLGFSGIAVMVHSLSDFGLHLPANGCLAAALCGLVVGLGGVAEPEAPRDDKASLPLAPRARYARTTFAAAGVAAVLILWGWALSGAEQARAAESHWAEARRVEESLIGRDWLGENEEFASLISHADAARKLEPLNVVYHYWLAVYRWRAISRVEDPETGDLLLTDETEGFARRIVSDLHEARQLCPSFGPLYCLVGQVERFVLGLDGGAARIRKGYRLAPSHPTVCFVAGLLDAAEGRMDDALEKFRRATTLERTLFGEIADGLIDGSGRPDLALELAGDDPHRIALVQAKLEATGGEYEALAAAAREKAVHLLKRQCETADAPASALATLAGLYHREREYEPAARYYQRALDLVYGQVGWRLALARCLVELERTEDAIHQARICLRLRPDLASAKSLIQELSGVAVRPDQEP